ncbi:uncharacterized protein TOL2_C31170 [Desulfobacula toluolica Tol2]|uniref:Uncharacterized protein n=1 Tax=Desulfobacula toluolica (strain DSM 7467 / Tol2) TaxID=651182 RepID=K0NKA0_DESTT|nr:uncharacterized protein TOL2_C31170 [Desulfobacula toluolica Tol2]
MGQIQSVEKSGNLRSLSINGPGFFFANPRQKRGGLEKKLPEQYRDVKLILFFYSCCELFFAFPRFKRGKI